MGWGYCGRGDGIGVGGGGGGGRRAGEYHHIDARVGDLIINNTRRWDLCVMRLFVWLVCLFVCLLNLIKGC